MSDAHGISTDLLSRFDSKLHFYRLVFRSDGTLKVGLQRLSLLLIVGVFTLLGALITVFWWPVELVGVIRWIIFFVGFVGLGFFLHNLYHSRHPILFDPIRGYCRKGWRLPPNQFYMGKQRFSLPFIEIRGVQILIKKPEPRGPRFGAEVNLILADNQRRNLISCAGPQSALRVGQSLAHFLGKPILASPDFQGYGISLAENQIHTTRISNFSINLRSRQLRKTPQGTLEFAVLPGARLFYQIPTLIGISLFGLLFLSDHTATSLLIIWGMAIGILVFAFIFKRLLASPVFFDLLLGYCQKGASTRQPAPDPYAREFRFSLKEIAGFQILEFLARGRKGPAYPCGEFNLVLNNGIRVHLFTSGNLQALYDDVRQLSLRTEIPILASPDFIPVQNETQERPVSGYSAPPAFQPTPLTAAQRKRHWIISFACFSPIWLMGLAFSGLAILDLYRFSSSADWPDTEGVVLHAETRKKHNGSGFSANIRYRYEVRGEEFTSSREGMTGFSFRTYQEAKEWLGRHPVGSRVTVYYHPRKPSLALLQPGFQPGILLLIFIGLLFIAIPLCLACFSVRRAEKRHQDKQRGTYISSQDL